jgi:benzoyl-CoA reductase/2-hydroxyglutaryl-CoA dehydratase subunit BcrC/BadD/HgdB
MVGSSSIQSKQSKLDLLVRSCRMIQRLTRAREGSSKSEVMYFQILTDYFSRVLNAHSQDKPVVLHTIFMPAEILYAMDIVPMHAETTSWMIPAFSGGVGSLLAKASELGLASEICSAHRVMAGGYALGDLPRPDAILWSNEMCDNSAKSGELLVKMNRCPGYFMDFPFHNSPQEMDYLVTEFRDMIDFLEKTTGRKMDWNRLSEIVARLDYQIELYREIFNLRKAIPSPFPMHRFTEFMMSLYLFPGQPEAISYLETLRDELSQMVKNGQGVVPHERFRLMSLFMPPVFMMGFLGEISREHGAVSVVEPLFGCWKEGRLDPGKPLESLVKKSFMFPENASWGCLDDRILHETVKCAQDFKVDGAIFYAHVGCRQGAGLIKTYRDILSQIDIPLLTLDMDLLDETVTHPEEIKIKMQEFFEILEDRK